MVDTGNKFSVLWLFLTGINDTREKCYRRCQRHKLFTSVNNTGDKLYWWQRSALAAKLSPAAEVSHGKRCVIGTAMKSCIQKHPTHLDQRPLRPPKLNNAVLVWSSFGGLQGLRSGFVRCLCTFSWLFQWQLAAVADFGGRRYRRFIPFNFLLSLAAPHLHGVLVLVTSYKFIASVVVTGDNWTPVLLSLAPKLLAVSLSPVINFSPVSTTPAITENLWQRLIAGVNNTGNKFFAGVVDTAEQFITGVVDTSDKQ